MRHYVQIIEFLLQLLVIALFALIGIDGLLELGDFLFKLFTFFIVHCHGLNVRWRRWFDMNDVFAAQLFIFALELLDALLGVFRLLMVLLFDRLEFLLGRAKRLGQLLVVARENDSIELMKGTTIRHVEVW